MEEQPAIEQLVEPRQRPVGNLMVARLLPWVRRRTVGPFVAFDHFGPVEMPPGEGFDVLPHPHIGLSTVTYLYAGENRHRDSLGTSAINRALDLNVMTAGRGVAHSERTEEARRAKGGWVHGNQLWLGLPVAREEDPPSFEHFPAASLPRVELGPGSSGRVLMGSAFGVKSPVVHPSQPLLVDLELADGTSVELAAEVPERGLCVIEGQVTIEEQALTVSQMAVLRPGRVVTATARGATRVLVLGGPALDGPRFLDWNFVSSSKERLAVAVRAWKERQFPAIPGDDVEFVPYPDRPGPPARGIP